MADIKKFRIRKKGFLLGIQDGLDFKDYNMVMKQNKECCTYISKVIDSMQDGTEWGRVILNCEISEESEYKTYTLALNYDIINYKGNFVNVYEFLNDSNITMLDKLETLEDAGAQVNNNTNDILVFNQKGRYFIFGIRIFSHKQVILKEIDIMSPKETLMEYLPEIYSTSDKDFFTRYMSIFGSIIHDKKEQLNNLSNYLNVDKTPDDVLPLLVSWLNIDYGVEFLEPAQMRRLIKMFRNLSIYKGTKHVLEGVAEIYLGEKPIIVEQFKLEQYKGIEEKDFEHTCESKINEFIILIKQKMDETMFLRFKNLIDKLSPIRAKSKIVCLERESRLNEYTYADINAVLVDNPANMLRDEDQAYDTDFIIT